MTLSHSARPAGPTAPRVLPELPASLTPSIRQAAELICLGGQETALQLGLEQLGDQLLPLLTGLPLLFGHSNTLSNSDDIDLMADVVAERILHRFPALTVAEIGLALRRGASGEWPQPNTLLLPNLPNIMHWLTCYSQQVRAQALEAIAKASAPQLALPPADPNRWYIEQLTALVAQATTSTLPTTDVDPGDCLYNWLKTQGGLHGFRPASYYEELRIEEAERILDRPLSFDRTRRIQQKSFAEMLEREEWDQTHPLVKDVHGACKKRVLREWLMDQALSDDDIQPVLEALATSFSDQQAIESGQ